MATMKIGVLGTGDVGRALGKAFITLGHEVRMGARSAANEKALAWAQEMGPKASAGTFADAADFGEIIVLATLGVANESALNGAGPERFRGKLVIDTTNPLDFSGGMPPTLAVSGNASCLKCHTATSKGIAPLAPLLHGIHLAKADQSEFVKKFGGECTHCHKLDRANGTWSLPSGAEK